MRKKNAIISATAGIALSLLASQSFAQQARWVSDVLYVPLRKGPSNQHTILHRGLKTGTKLSFIKTEDNWTQIRTPDGTIGWLPNQYIAEEPVAAIKLESANKKATQSGQRYQEAALKLKDLETENQTLKGQLSSSEEGLNSLSSELSQIKQVSAGAIDLNSNYQQLAKDHQLLQTELDIAKAENERLKKESSQKWFMYGAGAVLLGVIIALIAPALQPKKRHSEWG